MATCPNCLEPAHGRYCAACGQEQDVSPRSLWRLIRESFDEVLSADGTLPRSLFALVFRPGKLTVEWRAGRRVAWSHPFRLYLVCSLAFFSLSLVVDLDASFTVGSDFSADPGLADAQHAAQNHALGVVAPQALILVVPLLALFLRLVFRGGLAYVEHLVHALHIQSFVFVLLTGVFAISALHGTLGLYATPAAVLVLIGYVALSAKRVYGAGRWATATGSLLVFALFLVTSLSILGGAVVLFEKDPEAPLHEAEDGYWAVHDRFERGDTTRMAAWGNAVADDYRGLATYLVDASTRAHHAEAMLWADSARVALDIARQGLVTAPDDALLLRVAGLAALGAGDSVAAAEYRVRFLASYDGVVGPNSVLVRHASELEAFRESAVARSGAGNPPRP